MTRIFICSDIHTEFGNENLKLPNADILVLAGDIGNPLYCEKEYTTFLRNVSEQYKHVVCIAGNHEYYGCDYDMQKVQTRIRELCPSNVHFLQREVKILEGIEFIGATLWSCITKDACPMINDFRNGVFRQYLDYVEEFIDDYRFLRNALKTPSVLPRVVCTHHLPSYLCIYPSYEDNPANSAFATNILDSVNLRGVVYWACGHTHEKRIMNYMNTTFVVNPVGYPSESRKTFFDAKTVYEIPRCESTESTETLNTVKSLNSVQGDQVDSPNKIHDLDNLESHHHSEKELENYQVHQELSRKDPSQSDRPHSDCSQSDCPQSDPLPSDFLYVE